MALIHAFLAAGALAPGMKLDRAEFYEALARIEDGWTYSQVRKLLGPPDDVRTEKDPSVWRFNFDAVWCYGTDRHLGFPTLGRVFFRKDRALSTAYRPSRSFRQLMPESELRSLLRRMYRPPSTPDEFDPIWTIRMANLLRPFGKDKALFVVEQFYRVGAEAWLEEDAIPSIRLLQVLFAIEPDLKAYRRGGQVALVDDIPILVHGGGGFGSGPPLTPFELIDALKKEGKLLDRPLRPPDDPFASFEKARAKYWPDRPEGDLGMAAAMLIRTAYRAPELDQFQLLNEPDVSRLRKKFREAGARWSGEKQAYAPKSGSVLKDIPDLYPAVRWEPVLPDGFELEFSISRRNWHEADFIIEHKSIRGRRMHPCVYRLQTSSGKSEQWQSVYLQEPESGSVGDGEIRTFGSGWHQGPGKSYTIIVRYRGKEYKSPAFKV